MQDDLAATAEREARRRHHHRHVRVPQPHRRALERADHQIDFVPVAFLRLEQEQHQVRAGGEVQPVVADDERREVVSSLLDGAAEHVDGVAADGVHLRMELDAEHAVAEIDEAGAGVLPDDAFVGAGRLEQRRTSIA